MILVLFINLYNYVNRFYLYLKNSSDNISSFSVLPFDMRDNAVLYFKESLIESLAVFTLSGQRRVC